MDINNTTHKAENSVPVTNSHISFASFAIGSTPESDYYHNEQGKKINGAVGGGGERERAPRHWA